MDGFDGCFTTVTVRFGQFVLSALILRINHESSLDEFLLVQVCQIDKKSDRLCNHCSAQRKIEK